MSHITKLNPLETWRLDIFRRMCTRLGWEVKKQETFRSYRAEACDLAVDTKKANYEIGLKKLGDGTVDVLWDSYGPGGLTAVVGNDGGILRQEYDVTQTILNAANNLNGFVVQDMRDEAHAGWKEVVITGF